MLIVPRKRIWTQQPQYPAQIDWGNPITKGLQAAIIPLDSDAIDLVSGVRGTPVGNPSSSFNSFGRCLVAPTVSDYYTWPSTPRLNVIGAVSIVHIGVSFQLTRAILWKGDGAINTPYRLVGGASLALRRAGISDYENWAGPSTANGVGVFAVTNDGVLGSGSPSVFYNKTAIPVSVSGGGMANSTATADTGVLVACMSEQTNATLLFSRVLKQNEIASLSENPWQIFRAPDSRIFVPTGAGAGGGDSLIASSIIASPAVVSSPLLSQKHALTASSITTAPTVVANPAIIQRHALSSTAVSASPAVVGLPSITQRHALISTAISAAPAVVGLPTLTEIAAGVLSALPIVSAPAVVGAPAITQKHALSAGAISAGPATFGTPTLAQQHALMAQGITASPSAVGAPVLSEGGAAPFTAEQLLYLDANYVTIANISDIAAAVLAAIQATAIPVNVKQVNDVTIKGIGTQSNPWNPV